MIRIILIVLIAAIVPGGLVGLMIAALVGKLERRRDSRTVEGLQRCVCGSLKKDCHVWRGAL